MDLVLLIAASLLFTLGGVLMKYSEGLTRLWASLGVFLFFCLGAACQSWAMKRTDMGVAYLFVLGMEAMLALLLSVVVLKERATLGRVLALVLIVSGVVLLKRT